jgi:hypothetical protein
VTARLILADERALDWAQAQVSAHHYLHAPVDVRCSVMGYVLTDRFDGVDQRLGCLLFGRPEATRCYQGDLTYGSQADVASGRAAFDRWEVVNLARVWLDPSCAAWGHGWLATWVIGQALRRIVVDYLQEYPPCYIDEPWRLRVCLSYCDTRIHQGTIYKAAGFKLARTNADGIQTWYRPLRGLQGHERKLIERYTAQSYRSRVYRSQRDTQATQEAFL